MADLIAAVSGVFLVFGGILGWVIHIQADVTASKEIAKIKYADYERRIALLEGRLMP